MDDVVTISCPNHHQNLVNRLWNYFLSCRGVDFDVQCGGGSSIRAHHLILDLFLSSEKLNQSAQHLQQQHGRLIEFLLEFLYMGEVTVRREHLGTLLKFARESDFEMLVDVLQSGFFDTSFNHNGVVEQETLQNVIGDNKDYVDLRNGEFHDSGNSSASRGSCHEPCDWQAKTIKLEPAEVTPSPTGEQYSRHQVDLIDDIGDDQLNYIGIPQTNSQQNLVDPKLEAACGQQNPEIHSNVGLSCLIVSPNENPSGSANVEFDENIPCRELERPLPVVRDGRDHHIPSMAPWKADVVPPVVPPTTSSGSSLDCGPAPVENPERFDFRVKKIMVQPGRKIRKIQSGQHACTECGKTFTKSQLEAHLRTHTNERPFSCDLCEKTFSQLGNLKRHRMHRHTGERPYQCQQCPKGFVERAQLTKHQRTHGDKTSYQCKKTGCSATFVRKKDLSIHRMKDHLNLPPNLQCPKCERAFYLQSDFKNHARIHDSTQKKVQIRSRLHKKKLFECPTCQKSFHVIESLKLHQRLHGSGGKTYPCDSCPKVFYNISHLEVHSRTHTGIKPFQCPYCPKAFSQKGQLHIHIRSHTNERPYHCDVEGCDRTFQQNPHLAYHKLTHAGIKAFKCTHPNCTKKYYTLSELNQHFRRHGQDRPFVCEVCGSSYFTLKDLNGHVQKIHATDDDDDEQYHECDICGETFEHLANLNVHADTHL